MSSVWDVERWVDEAALSAIKMFYPTALTRNISLPLSEIFKHLLFLVEQKKLEVVYDIRCPECYATVNIVNSCVASGDIIECPLGHEFELTADVIFPVFKISESYKEYVRQYCKKKLKRGSMLRGEIPV
ncbi:hypothetical protein [Carboxydothermus pertinax]|uniref:Uncharacterized protein n=1 Tax=Carboxydothermus pertinax TaxID=870242 RepID=A0A1L8CRV3_9THEO|nr:hypothetical protein [Carboxydothermus pertinax]GAV21627.1 hypothetical protein cpu_01370 [Carboxydothermus pertinax]